MGRERRAARVVVQQRRHSAGRVERKESERAGDGGGAVAEDERREELGPGLRRGQVAREGRREGQRGSGSVLLLSAVRSGHGVCFEGGKWIGLSKEK